jgi:hypothetical protein
MNLPRQLLLGSAVATIVLTGCDAQAQPTVPPCEPLPVTAAGDTRWTLVGLTRMETMGDGSRKLQSDSLETWLVVQAFAANATDKGQWLHESQVFLRSRMEGQDPAQRNPDPTATGVASKASGVSYIGSILGSGLSAHEEKRFIMAFRTRRQASSSELVLPGAAQPVSLNRLCTGRG